jgi:hypothetical protein
MDAEAGAMCWRGLLLGLVLFRLVVPPFQPGVVGPYPVQSVWFPSHLPFAARGTRGTRPRQVGSGNAGTMLDTREARDTSMRQGCGGELVDGPFFV